MCDGGARYPGRLLRTKQFLSLSDFVDEEIEEETECNSASTSAAVDSWLSYPAQNTRRLNHSYSDSVLFSPQHRNPGHSTKVNYTLGLKVFCTLTWFLRYP